MFSPPPQPPVSGLSAAPESAEVQEEEQEHLDKEEEEEEKVVEEREEEKKVVLIGDHEQLSVLYHRQKLVQDLGVVSQIQQLLQGHREGGGANDFYSQQQRNHQRQHRKVRPDHQSMQNKPFLIYLFIYFSLLK